MSFHTADPVVFFPLSATTSSLGVGYGQVGDRCAVGGREYVLVYNDCNSEIYPGYGLVLQSGATGMSVSVSAVTSADIVVGVVRNATIATGYYGWAVTRGITPLELNATSGTVAAGDLVEVGANGDFQKVSNTTGNPAPALGTFLEAGVSGASASAYIRCF